MKKVVIIDNNSDYPPLIEYYDSLSPDVQVERMKNNFGHMVFFENPELLKKYGKGYYVVTDADIVPNRNLPDNFLYRMINLLDKYGFKRTKVGFALDLQSIPDSYPHKDKVINWEKKFWKEQLETGVYSAIIDTTFALYKPRYPAPLNFNQHHFYKGVRIAGDFTAKHMGWYIDPDDMTDEQLHYFKTSSASNSWKLDDQGNLNTSLDY